MAIWWSRKKSSNKILLILSLIASASCLPKYQVYYALYQYFKKAAACIYSPKKVILSFSLGRKICVANESTRCTLGEANSGSTDIPRQSHLIANKDEYTPEEKAMRKYGNESGPAKADRHFSQLLDSKVS